MGSIVVKYQKCGKSNCKCTSGVTTESLHGPYYWQVRYIKPRNSLKKGKYKWTYIGKTAEEVNLFRQNHPEDTFAEKPN